MSSVTTTEEARELAARWAVQEWRDGDRGKRPDPSPFWALDADERERLFAWVRERMAAVERSWMNWHDELAQVIADDLMLHSETAWAMCEASGWPS